MDIDRSLFTYINSYPLPDVVTDTAIYVHGYKNAEVAFFLFCLILGAVLLVSPKKGIRASIAVFIASMSSFVGGKYLTGVFSRPFPYLDEGLASQLRVEPLTSLSAFPVPSILLFTSVAMAMIYYFPKYSALMVGVTLIYTLMPVYLGVAYPSDAAASLALGSVFSYFLMTTLGRNAYFKRF